MITKPSPSNQSAAQILATGLLAQAGYMTHLASRSLTRCVEATVGNKTNATLNRELGPMMVLILEAFEHLLLARRQLRGPNEDPAVTCCDVLFCLAASDAMARRVLALVEELPHDENGTDGGALQVITSSTHDARAQYNASWGSLAVYMEARGYEPGATSLEFPDLLAVVTGDRRPDSWPDPDGGDDQ